MIDTPSFVAVIARLRNITSTQATLRECVLADASKHYTAATWQRSDAVDTEEASTLCHPWNSHADAYTSPYTEQERILQGIEQMWFVDGQGRKETLTFPGLIAASDGTLKAVSDVNDARAAFKKAVVALKNEFKKMTYNDIEQEIGDVIGQRRDNYLRVAFKRAGITRFCIKQAYRPIPHVDDRELVYAQYYKKLKQSITRTAADVQLEKAAKKLQQHPSSGYQEAYDKLARLPSKTPLAEVRNISRVITVNIKTQETDQEPVYGQVTGVLPIFYKDEPNKTLVLHDMSRLGQEQRKPAKRSDVTVDPEVYIPIMRLHKYLTE